MAQKQLLTIRTRQAEFGDLLSESYSRGHGVRDSPLST